MSDDNKKKKMEKRAKEGLLRLGLIDDMSSVEDPIEKYVGIYREHITYQAPVTEDYLPSNHIVISNRDYNSVEHLCEVFELESVDDTAEILVYDDETMAMPHIVEVEKEEIEDEEEDEYNLTLHMAHQDSAWYLRNRLVSRRNILITASILSLSFASGGIVVFLTMSSLILGFIVLFISLFFLALSLYIIPLVILSFILND